MARGVWVFDKETQQLVPKDEYYARKHGAKLGEGPTVIKDIEPYKNIINGEVIGGRKQHRDFLKAHGVTEVGNEDVKQKYQEPPPVAEDIKRAMHETGYWRR